VNILCLILSLPACFALLCRMDGLNLKNHKIEYIGLHLCLFIGCVIAVAHSFQGAARPEDFAVVLATLCWIGISLHTWRVGIPDHVRRKPKQA
jgi:hypothetical protein